MVGESATGEDVLEKAHSLKADVIVLDVRLPGISGIEVCRRLRTIRPDIHVVILSSFAEPDEVQAAFSAGASGYVLKNITSGTLIEAIKSVVRGETFIDPEISEQAIWVREGSVIDEKSGLTKREEEILTYLAQGKTNKEIGRELYLSEKTIRNHVSRILEKLGLSNRSQAAVYVARRGIYENIIRRPES